MSRNKLRAGALIALCVLLSLIAASITLPLLLQYRPVQQLIIKEILDHYGLTNARVSFSKARVVFWNPLEIQADDIKIQLPRGAAPITLGQVSAQFAPSNLFEGDYIPQVLTLSNFTITLPFGRSSGRSPMESGRPLASLFALLSRIKDVSLLNGSIKFSPSSIEIRKIYLRLASMPLENSSAFRAIATLKKGEAVAPLLLRGVVSVDPKTKSPVIHARVSAPHLLLSLFPPFHHLDLRGGEAKVMLKIDGTPESLAYTGKISTVNPEFLAEKGNRYKRFHFASLDLSMSGNYRHGNLSISRLQLNGPDFSLKGSLEYYTHHKNRGLNLEISSPWMDYATFRNIFPDPLVSQWLSKKLFPIIDKGKVHVEQFRLKGSMDQIAHLDRPPNRSCLSLKVSWKKLRALKNNGPFEFDHVSGKLVISNGSLEINDLKGHYGQSVVSKASVRLPDLYGQADRIFITLDGLLELSQLPQLAESPYAGTHIPDFLKKVSKAQGVMPLKVRGKWLVSQNSFLMDLAHFGPASCTLRHNDLDVKIQNGSVNFRAGFGYRIKGIVALGKSSIKVTGWSDEQHSSLAIHAKGHADFVMLTRLFPVLSSLKINSHRPSEISLSITKASDALTVECNADVGRLYVRPTSWLGITGQKGDTLFFRMVKKVGDGPLTGHAILFQEQGFVDGSFVYDPGNSMIKLNIQTPKARAEGLEVFLGAKRYRIGAGFSCDLKVTIPRNQLSQLSVFGTLQGYGITVGKQAPPIMLNNCQLGVEFEGKEVYVNCMRTEVSGVPVFISGHLKGWRGLEGRLQIEMEQLDLAPLIQTAKGPERGEIHSFPYLLLHQSNIRINVKIANTLYNTLLLGTLKAGFALRDGNIYLEQCEISSKPLKIALIGYLKSQPRPDYYLGVYIKSKNFPIQDLFKTAASERPLLEGRLTMEALVSSQGSDLKNLIKNLSGQANFSITKGKIIKSTILIKLLDFFSVQKIFIKKPPDLSKQGFYFEEIRGSLDVSNGVAHSDEVVMKSPVLNAILRGKADLATGRIKADLGAQPFVTIDSILTRVPVIGYILTGKERALLVYYFKVRGSLREPKLTYVPLKNIGRSVLLFFRRAFFTPVRIFKNIKKFAQDLAKKGKPVPVDEFNTLGH